MTHHNPTSWTQYQGPVKPRNGLGTTSLVLGITGIVVGFLPFIGAVAFGLGTAAIAFGLFNTGRISSRQANNPSVTTFGILAGVASVIMGVIGIVVLFQGLDQVNKDLHEFNDKLDRVEECVEGSENTDELTRCRNE